MENCKVTLFRYDPDIDKEPCYEHYEIPYDPTHTVLDSLSYIHEKYDRGLSFRGECGFQMCGTCAVRMNGKAVLACNAKVEKRMLIEPLPDMPIIKDLVVDRTWMYDRANLAKPFFIRKAPVERQPETISRDDYELHATAAACIECYVCTASCPLYDEGTDPASNLKISWFALDSRDDLSRIEALSDFASKCVVCTTCTGVCPLGIRVDRLVLRARERLVEERGLSLMKKTAIRLLNFPSVLWTLVRFGYPLRGLIFSRDKNSFPVLAKRAFQLKKQREVKP